MFEKLPQLQISEIEILLYTEMLCKLTLKFMLTLRAQLCKLHYSKFRK